MTFNKQTHHPYDLPIYFDCLRFSDQVTTTSQHVERIRDEFQTNVSSSSDHHQKHLQRDTL